ncbi:MAG: hypothetical protein QNK11_02340 [Legionella sp.]|nr:hypothetical protein [Legionella sp.]
MNIKVIRQHCLELIEALKEINPEVLQRKYLRGIDTFYDTRSELTKITMSFEALLEQGISSVHEKQVYMALFESRKESLLSLLPNGPQRENAESILDELDGFQQRIIADMIKAENPFLRARL